MVPWLYLELLGFEIWNIHFFLSISHSRALCKSLLLINDQILKEEDGATQ